MTFTAAQFAPPQWQPCVSFHDAGPDAQEDAVKLKAVLADFMAIKDTDRRTQAEFEAAGVAAYKKIFGHAVSGRWFRYLYKRTIDREHAGCGGFDRLELYLHDNISPQPKPRRPEEKQFCHAELAADVKSILDRPGRNRKENPARLTKDQRQCIWVAAWRHLNILAPGNDADREAAKRSIRRHIFATVPHLAGSHEALRRNFNRKCFELAKTGKPSSIADQRGFCSGWYRGPEITAEAHKVIVAYAVLACGGRAAQAWRHYAHGIIPGIAPDAALVDYWTSDAACKSYVPRRILEDVKYDIAALETLHHGIYQYEQTAHLKLDDSSIHAGDWWSSDDCTLPVYFWIYGGKRGYTLMRGQLLLTVDHRSRRILGFALIPHTAYDSMAIRNHIVDVADDFGLPRRGFIWERGIWKRAKLIKGADNADFVPPEEAEHGLLEHGMEFIHRLSPKAKIVESVLGRVENLTEGEPGYCGRHEMKERFESFQQMALDVEAGRVNPEGKLYSFDQWVGRLEQICAQYNEEAYGGDTKLGGRSPNQAFEEWQNHDDPPVQYDAAIRYLLSTHRRPVTVTSNGICFECGKRQFLYRNKLTGDLVGRRVLIWFDPERPDIAYVTDLQGKNPFAVPSYKPLPAVGAPKELLAEEMRKLREHQAPMRILYRTLATQFKQVFRQNLVSPEIVARGRAFDDGAAQIRTEQDTAARKSKRARQVAQELGVRIPAGADDLDALNEGLAMEREVQEERRRRQQAQESAR
jgi:hypothetical protein